MEETKRRSVAWTTAKMAFLAPAYWPIYWRAMARELDRIHGRSHILPVVSLAAWYYLFGIILYAVFVASSAALGPGPALTPGAAEAAGPLAHVPPLLFFSAAMLLILSFITYLFGMWRVWTSIRGAQRARGRSRLLRPGLQLFLTFVPLGVLVMVALTTHAHNRIGPEAV